MVEKLLSKGAEVNAKTDDGTTALIYAASGGHLVVVQKLLTAGADIHARTRSTGGFFNSRTQGCCRMRAMLVDGAHPDEGAAFVHAARAEKLGIIILLVEAGAGVNAQESDGNTALHYAAQWEM